MFAASTFRRLSVAALCSTVLGSFLFGVVTQAAGTVRGATSGQVPYPIASNLPANVQAFLTQETSPDLFNIEHHYGTVSPAANGSYLNNEQATPSGPWAVEDQRYASVDIYYGILHDDTAVARTGLQMLDYAFSREAANGSFPKSVGLFHGTAMFLAAAGPSLLMVKNWDKASTIPRLSDGHTVSWMVGRAHAAARYLVNTWWAKPKHIDDGGKEERFFEGALALQSVGVLSGDTTLTTDAAAYARNGMAMTIRSGPNAGVWTEHGVVKSPCCYDASYQALGMSYSARYLSLLSNTTSTLYSAVRSNLQLGEQWEFSRTHADGSVTITGDDRTYNGKSCPETDSSGRCKKLDYTAVADALMRWGVATGEAGDGQFVLRAYYVALRFQEMNGVKLPAPQLVAHPNTMKQVDVGYGQPVFISGAGFKPYEPVTIWFNSVDVGSTIANGSGSFGYVPGKWSTDLPPVQIKIPTNLGTGTYTVKGVGAYGSQESTSFQIT